MEEKGNVEDDKFRPGVSKFITSSGRTQQSLADELGCSRSRVAQWCNGNADISRTDCGLLIKLGMPISDLFGQDVEDYIVEKYSSQKMDPSTWTEEDCVRLVQRGLFGLTRRKLSQEGEEPLERR